MGRRGSGSGIVNGFRLVSRVMGRRVSGVIRVCVGEWFRIEESGHGVNGDLGSFGSIFGHGSSRSSGLSVVRMAPVVS